MMHYRKGENVEHEITKSDLPFNDCMPAGTKDFLWMHVKGGTRVNNVISYAKNALEKNDYRTVVWSGSGGGLVKTISCAEILKRSFPLYQVTRICYTIVEEHWIPQMDGLEEIVANRQIPCIHILMSLDAIDDAIKGLQKPNTKTTFWSDSNNTAQPAGQQYPQRSGRNPRKRQNRNKQPKQENTTEPKQEHKPQREEQENRNPRKPKNFNKAKNESLSQEQPKPSPQQNTPKQKYQKQPDQSNAESNRSNNEKPMDS